MLAPNSPSLPAPLSLTPIPLCFSALPIPPVCALEPGRWVHWLRTNLSRKQASGRNHSLRNYLFPGPCFPQPQSHLGQNLRNLLQWSYIFSGPAWASSIKIMSCQGSLSAVSPLWWINMALGRKGGLMYVMAGLMHVVAQWSLWATVFLKWWLWSHCFTIPLPPGVSCSICGDYSPSTFRIATLSRTEIYTSHIRHICLAACMVFN